MLSITKKLIEDASRRLLIISEESILIEDLIGQISSLYPDRLTIVFQEAAGFVDSFLNDSMFIESKRILVLRELTSEELPVIENILDLPSEDIVVIVECSTVSKNKMYTRIKASYLNLKLEKPTDSECIVWARNYLKKNDISFEENVPEVLVKKTGNDLTFLRSEARKISFLQRNGMVTTLDVEKSVCAFNEVQYFVLSDLFFRKRIQEFLLEVKRVEESTYIKFLHFMIGQAERLLRVASYREAKNTDDEIADLMSLPKYIIKTKFYPAIGYFGKLKLIKLLDLFNALDLDLRSSKFPKEDIFEAYMVKAFHL